MKDFCNCTVVHRVGVAVVRPSVCQVLSTIFLRHEHDEWILQSVGFTLEKEYQGKTSSRAYSKLERCINVAIVEMEILIKPYIEEIGVWI